MRPVLTMTALTTVAACAAAFVSAAPAAAPNPLHVPVLQENFPDPFVLPVGRHFLAYSTNHDERNVPVAVSTNLVDWKLVRDEKNPKLVYDAMPTLAPWVSRGRTWAPEVMEVGGRYVLYFTAHHRKLDVQCLGAAVAGDPLGPFVSTDPEPLVCQPELGGTIDANPFRDADGKLYLYYKNDGNNPRVLKPSQIWGQRLSADGLRVEGKPVSLLRNDVHWEWRVVEAPAMVRRPDGYTMFFSANHFGWEADQRISNYGTGYATCKGPLGPCTDAAENPWLRSYNHRSVGCLSGPGHPTVFSAGTRQFIAFHAWDATAGCRPARHQRELFVAPLGFQGGKPLMGPSLRPATGAAR